MLYWKTNIPNTHLLNVSWIYVRKYIYSPLPTKLWLRSINWLNNFREFFLLSGEIKNIYLSINIWSVKEANAFSLIINCSCSHKTSDFHPQTDYFGIPSLKQRFLLGLTLFHCWQSSPSNQKSSDKVMKSQRCFCLLFSFLYLFT